MALILGRTILRPWVEAKMANSPQFKAIDGAISREGFKIVFLLRASPAFPFGICSYLLSTTSIDMVKLFPATFLGNIPGASMHTFLGNFVGSLAEVDKGVELDVKSK